MKITVFSQSAIKLAGKINVYFDPYNIKEEYHDADYLFLTHNHYDHYDEKSIAKVWKKETKIIIPKALEESIAKLTSNYLVVDVHKHYVLEDLEFTTLWAYNINKPYHLKESLYVGYNVLIEGLWYYVMGDTDSVLEIQNVVTDVCFVPIGGIYTMDYQEAASYINKIKPHLAIPIHYGSIVGDITLGEKFKKLVNNNIKVEIYLKKEEEL